MEYDIFDLQKVMSKVLTEKRFFHTLGVQTISFALAIQYGYDTSKATLAGLLHDCAKCIPDKVLLSQCEEYALPISEVERRNPYLLHGKLGAYHAEHNYGITDCEILTAIAYHTTGKTAMTLLEKIVFVADFIEPNRSSKQIPNLNVIRKESFSNLDHAVYMILNNTLVYLKNEYKEIDNLTVEAYDYYKLLQNNDTLKGDYND